MFVSTTPSQKAFRRRRAAWRLSALAAPLAPLILLSSSPAFAAAQLSLDTRPVFSATSLTITATGSFSSGFVENTTVAIQAVGTETWTDANGTHTRPLQDTPTQVRFANSNTVTVVFSLHTNSIVDVSYTAEVVGLAPNPWTGSCSGVAVRTGSSGAPLTYRTC